GATNMPPLPVNSAVSRASAALAASTWSYAAPACSASAIAARVPCISVSRLKTGQRLERRSAAACSTARCTSSSRLPIHATAIHNATFWCRPDPRRIGKSREPRLRQISERLQLASRSPQRSIVLDVSEALVGRRRPFERASLLGRLPLDDVLDLSRQLEILVGDALRGVVHQPHFDPGVGCGD